MSELLEILPNMFEASEWFVEDFNSISVEDKNKNIKEYFDTMKKNGQDPRDPASRQVFNENALNKSGMRYLIGRYGEDRSDVMRGSHIYDEGRVIHMGIDMFCKDQEPVFAPCDGEIIVSDYEPGVDNYGNYLILRPDDDSLPNMFFGHLANEKLPVGRVSAGQQIARLGSFENTENGGWSIHLHFQLMTEMPERGKTPIGYSSHSEWRENSRLFPNPMSVFLNWAIRR